MKIFLMQLSSCEIDETQLVKILPLWLMSEMDAVDGGNNQFQIRKKCGSFMDAFIKSRSCRNKIGKDFAFMEEVRIRCNGWKKLPVSN